jgi:hypothetical protein
MRADGQEITGLLSLCKVLAGGQRTDVTQLAARCEEGQAGQCQARIQSSHRTQEDSTESGRSHAIPHEQAWWREVAEAGQRNNRNQRENSDQKKFLELVG